MNHRSLSGIIITTILFISIIIAVFAPASLYPKIIALGLVDGRLEISVLDLNSRTRQYVTNHKLIAVSAYSYCEAKKQVAYSAFVGYGEEIISQDLVTAQTRALTQGNNNFRRPDWSPDCSMLAFTSDGSNPSMFIFNLESSTTDPVPVDEGLFLQGASWSPNSNFLATYVPLTFLNKREFNLGIIDIATHKLTRLRGLTDYPFSEAVWNANSDKLYFSTRQEASSFDLYEFDLTTGLQTPIVQTEFDDHYPKLSPDGKYLSFLRSPSMSDRYLGVFDLLSKRTELITTSPKSISATLWLDNRRLILSEYNPSQNETTYYVVDIRTKTFKKISRFDGQFINPQILRSQEYD